MHEFSFDQAYLFNTGSDIMSYNLLGSHKACVDQVEGYNFSVWAPMAGNVSVVGDFNEWDSNANPLNRMQNTGIFHGFVPGAKQWQRYKYAVTSSSGKLILKADPYAVHSETRQGTSSVLYCLDDGFNWNDKQFLENRDIKFISNYDNAYYTDNNSNNADYKDNHSGNSYKDNNTSYKADSKDDDIAFRNGNFNTNNSQNEKPVNIYEVHLGSWRQYPDGSFFDYKKLAHELASYVKEMGYTHIELLPIMEHPLDDSWGYQVTGFYSPTSRFGTPYDFKYFVNHMHEQGIGVILDWVPGHFPKDEFGLARFDGSAVFEYADDRIGEHKEWGTYVFNYSRDEVRSFLISNAVYWIDVYHVDGIRVDAVSSMLYLNYCRTNFMRNINGGVENLEAVSFLQKLNSSVLKLYPGVMMIAEESTAWPKVTAPVWDGGLGFTYKWNMGWMHDTLEYFSRDYIYRKWHQSQLSFSLVYAFSEKFILPLSHDEIVHGKSSMIGKMPGDNWRKFASLRTLYAYMIAHPGGKLMFMGCEFGQFVEWRFKDQLEWFMLEHEQHFKLKEFVKALNHLFLNEKSFWEQNHSWDGFSWHSADDSENCIFIFSRISKQHEISNKSTNPGTSDKPESVLIILNMAPNPVDIYKIGVREKGDYEVILDSDSIDFGGSGFLSLSYPVPVFQSVSEDFGGFSHFIELPIPPLCALYLKKYERYKT